MTLRVVSFGGAVKSTCLLALAAQGRIDYSTFLLADVGSDSEHPATLRYLHDVAVPFAKAHGLTIHELHRIGRDGTREAFYGRPGAAHIADRRPGLKPAGHARAVLAGRRLGALVERPPGQPGPGSCRPQPIRAAARRGHSRGPAQHVLGAGGRSRHMRRRALLAVIRRSRSFLRSDGASARGPLSADPGASTSGEEGR